MQNVLIVGAGTGGSIILDLLQNVDFMKVKAIIDVDENAPGIQLAKDLGVSHGVEWRSWLTEDVHIIFDVTGNSSVFAKLMDARPAHTVLIPGSVANLLIQLLQENTRHLDHIQTEMRILMEELESARSIIRKLEATYTFDDIIGNSAEMEISIAQAKLAAQSDIPVLLRGESGTGKELYAHAIHNSSMRQYKPFIRVNCASLNPITAEDELFGRVTSKGKQNFFEEADQGTLFIDEVADLSLAIQQKLLRYLTEGMIYHEGYSQPIRFLVRIVTATSKNLEKAMSEGTFLEELYYVLNRIAIQIVPLRSRKEDIPSIVSHILVKLNRELGMNILQVENAVLERLMQYDWPGNVRELENVLSRAMIYMDADETVLGLAEVDKSLSPREYKAVEQLLSEKSTLASIMEEHEKEILEAALRENKGNKSLTANRLGISLRSLYYKLEKYSLI